MKLLKVLLGVVALNLLSGCPNKAPSDIKSEEPVRNLYFVKGDPRDLIKGATSNPKSPFTNQNIEQLNEFFLSSLSQYFEKEPLVKETTKKDSKTPPADSDIRSLKIQKANGHWTLSLLANNLHFQFKELSDGTLQPFKAYTEKSSIELNVIHWSQSKDGNHISVLFSTYDDADGVTLSAFYFEKKAEQEPLKVTSKPYKYLIADGAKYRWKDEVTIKFCGETAEASLVRDAVSKWQKVLKDSLKIKFEQTSTFAPFSDLNEHCLKFVDSYVYEMDENEAAYGVNVALLSHLKRQIIDADIFIFRKEFGKILSKAKSAGLPDERALQIISKDLTIALVHEVGHFLGLGHQFDKTKSVMSYDFDSFEPTEYDINAISELYKKD